MPWITFGITGWFSNCIRLIHSYLSSCEFSVKLGDHTSSAALLLLGFLLSPELFIVYMSHFPRRTVVQIAIYTDDTVLFTSPYSEELVYYKRVATDWSCKWKLQINESKGVIIRFTSKRCLPYNDIYEGKMRLSSSTPPSYLGVILNTRLTFNLNVSEIYSRMDHYLGPAWQVHT